MTGRVALIVAMQDVFMLMRSCPRFDQICFFFIFVGVAKMRDQYRQKENGNKCNLTDVQISQLESVGFQWRVGRGKAARSWDDFYNDIQNFRQEHG